MLNQEKNNQLQLSFPCFFFFLTCYPNLANGSYAYPSQLEREEQKQRKRKENWEDEEEEDDEDEEEEDEKDEEENEEGMMKSMKRQG